ncbi:MAG TPA: HypC/HybG/HupF family hydrogenase formation chaperone [Bacteroidales bacterium]|nr:HypC/HybG/HupF family hydrogenase formation chaperone [Bacteroidales bacterium]HOK75251.1 HypC/HybG/HupF family hydrogenase formation chaperone [Bacteroidales bacterium]HOM41276.1 HypC/HybG/HupF family hydrogenase formation chaperone [Bacteroidales bacterium]HPP93174.1 HypC/HybG/HupF family hydrogenase formation chaperone [Bacteroidales bacterium]HQK71910.1 HypC/HybG/HupF family hydrogenase formation chaperone [Bacteroidales bacterium]
MCLSLPAKVIEVNGDMADVSVGGTIFKAGLQLLDDVKPGDYVLLHAGFAIQKIKEDEAREILGLLEEMEEQAD